MKNNPLFYNLRDNYLPMFYDDFYVRIFFSAQIDKDQFFPWIFSVFHEKRRNLWWKYPIVDCFGVKSQYTPAPSPFHVFFYQNSRMVTIWGWLLTLPLLGNVIQKKAPNGSVPQNICSYRIFGRLARKRNR